MARDQLTGFPRGWFVVAYANELGDDEVKPLRYFGRDLVMFRANGEAAVLDAHCPHLGAHLGYGGSVVDGTIECPFHAWRFGTDGACAGIPYAKKVPSRARIKSWPVRERNGLIFAWHGPDGVEPDYEIPVLEGYGTPEWLPWNQNVVQVKTHPREIVENVADKGHFPVVHGTHVDVFENIYDRHMATQITEGVAYPRGGGSDQFKLRATYYGPGYQISEMAGYLQSKLLLAHTPIEEDLLDLRFAVTLKITGDLERTAGFAEQYVENLRTGFHEDIQIWEHKVYRGRPVMCDGDGPIGKLRVWYRQFYEASA